MLKKLLLIFTIILFFIFTCVSCDDNEYTPLDIDIDAAIKEYEDLFENPGEWAYDPTGTFSFISLNPRGNFNLVFDESMVFPNNIFIYETNKLSIDDVKMYGYMDTEFKRLSPPISAQPNIFMSGFARIQTIDDSYIINTDFKKVDEYYPGYIISDNSLIEVNWTHSTIDEPFIISNPDFDNYLVPYKVNLEPGINTNRTVVGYKSLNDTCFKETSAEDKFAISPIFDEAQLFFEGIAAVKANNKWGFINEDGEIVVDFLYDDAKSLSYGLAAVYKSEIREDGSTSKGLGKWAVIDMYGTLLTPFEFYDVNKFSDGLARVTFSSTLSSYIKYGYINTDCEKVTPVLFDYITGLSKFSDDYILMFNSGFYFYDKEGNQAFNRRFNSGTRNFSDGLAVFSESGSMKKGYFNTNGQVAISKKYSIAKDFSKGYAYVISDMKQPGYLIDKLENKYLEGLGLKGISRFNDDGYALAYTVVLNTYKIPDPNNPPEFITEEREDTIYFIIHIENTL